LVENVIWGRGLAENVKIPSHGRKGSKIAKKIVIYLNVPLENSYSCEFNLTI